MFCWPLSLPFNSSASICSKGPTLSLTCWHARLSPHNAFEFDFLYEFIKSYLHLLKWIISLSVHSSCTVRPSYWLLFPLSLSLSLLSPESVAASITSHSQRILYPLSLSLNHCVAYVTFVLISAQNSFLSHLVDSP